MAVSRYSSKGVFRKRWIQPRKRRFIPSVVAGASEALAATVDAVSAVSGSIQVARQLAAVSAGVSTTTGNVVISRTLAATTAGVSTVSGSMSVSRSLSAASDAVSTTTSNLSVTKTLSAVSAAASSVSGNINVSRNLSAISAAVSSVSGDVTRSLACSGIVAGVASVSGNINVLHSLAATSNAVSATLGDIDVNRALATASAGVSSVSGILLTDTEIVLAATSNGVSSVSGGINVSRSISALVAGISAVSGNISVLKTLAATSNGVSTLAGNTNILRSFAAQTDGISSVSGALLAGETLLAAQVSGVSTVAGSLGVLRTFAAISSGVSSISGNVNLGRKVSGVASGVAGVSGAVSVSRRFSGVAAGVSTVSGSATVSNPTVNPYADLVLNTQPGNILGFWRLNESVGATVAIDSSPAGQDSVALNNISFGNPSLLGGDEDNECALFPGTSTGYIRLENNVNNGPLRASQFTISGWFKMPTSAFGTSTSTGTGGVSAIPLVTKGRSETDSAGFNVNYFMGIATNKLCGDFESGSGTNHPITGSTTLVPGRWYFGAITYNGTHFRLYLNGVADATAVATTDVPDITTAQPACVGSAMTTGAVAAGGFNGYIDEVVIWNTALTASQILALWETGRITKVLSGVSSGISTVSGGVLLSSGLADIEDFSLVSQRTGIFGLSHSTSKNFNSIRVGNRTFRLKK